MGKLLMEHYAYTDGACSMNGLTNVGGWAALVDGQLISGWCAHTTNNAMELFAVFNAVDHTPANSEITIYADSRLVIGWLRDHWKCRHAHLLEIIKSYFATLEGKNIRVHFEKVKGHSNNPLNILVDREAVLQVKIGKNALIALKTGGLIA